MEWQYDECTLCHQVIRRPVDNDGKAGPWEHTEEHPARPTSTWVSTEVTRR